MVDADNGEGIWPGSSSMSYPKQLSPHLELQLLRGGAAPGLGWMQQSLQQAERCKGELVETWSCFDSSDRVLELQREAAQWLGDRQNWMDSRKERAPPRYQFNAAPARMVLLRRWSIFICLGSLP